MRPIMLAAALAAVPALAHEGPAVHAHPHGAEAIAIGLAVAALAWLLRGLLR
jgi:hypothetical protein